LTLSALVSLRLANCRVSSEEKGSALDGI